MSNPPDGNQSAFLQRDGSVSQTISGFDVGASYALTFWAAQRSDNGSSGGNNPLSVTVNGQTVFGPTLPPSTNWSMFSTASFIATAPTQTITISGTNTGQDATAFLDAIAIKVVPNPGATAGR